MAELKQSGTEVKYGIPLRTALGDLFLTATRLEFPASAEAVTGGVKLNLAKLGLTVESVAGAQSAAVAQGGLAPLAGETAATTSLPIFAWATPAVEAKTAGEAAKAISAAFPVSVEVTESGISPAELTLRFYVLKVATANEAILTEGLTANKAKNTVGGLVCTVFVLGK